MSSQYDAVAARSAATIAKKGATVLFPGAAPGVYNPATDEFTGVGGGDVKGKAVQIDGDPDTLAALSLIGVDNVTLMVSSRFTDTAGSSVAFTPIAPVAFQWPEGGKTYTTKSVNDVAPDGTAILYIIVGSR